MGCDGLTLVMQAASLPWANLCHFLRNQKEKGMGNKYKKCLQWINWADAVSFYEEPAKSLFPNEKGQFPDRHTRKLNIALKHKLSYRENPLWWALVEEKNIQNICSVYTKGYTLKGHIQMV